jgi:hypothetical protein
MNQKLSGLAKVSFLQALKLNPDEPIARQYIDQVSGTNGTNSGGTGEQKNNPQAKNDKKGGFFGWLGGG